MVCVLGWPWCSLFCGPGHRTAHLLVVSGKPANHREGEETDREGRKGWGGEVEGERKDEAEEGWMRGWG